MSYIKVELDYPIEDGTQITFKAPAANTAVEGLKVYYPNVTDNAVTTTSKTFTFVDSANAPFSIKNITAFAADSYVNVILNLTDSLAYVQNPTNNTVTQGLIDEVTTLATTYATTSKAGVVKVGSGLSVTSDGTLSSDIPTATKDTTGVIKVGEGLSVTGDGTVSVNTLETIEGITYANATSPVSSSSNVSRFFVLNDQLYYWEKTNIYSVDSVTNELSLVVDNFIGDRSGSGFNDNNAIGYQTYKDKFYAVGKVDSNKARTCIFDGTSIISDNTANVASLSLKEMGGIAVTNLNIYLYTPNDNDIAMTSNAGDSWVIPSMRLPYSSNSYTRIFGAQGVVFIGNPNGSLYYLNESAKTWRAVTSLPDATNFTNYRYCNMVTVDLPNGNIGLLRYYDSNLSGILVILNASCKVVDVLKTPASFIEFMTEPHAVLYKNVIYDTNYFREKIYHSGQLVLGW